MEPGGIDNTPVSAALAAVGAAVTELITAIETGGLDHHDAAEVLILLDRHATIMNRLQSVDAELIAAGQRCGVVEHTGQRTMAKVIEQVCRVSSAEARRRSRAAEHTATRVSPIGMPLPRLRERLGAAMTRGTVNPEQTGLACRTLALLDRAGVDPSSIKKVETELVEHAGQYGPRELSQLCRRYLDIYDPDGTEPDDQRNHDRRSLTMRHTPAGAVVGEFRLTGATGAKLAAILEPLAKPRIDRIGDGGGPATASQPGSQETITDRRTREQRLHDALDDACSRLLRTGGLPETGGVPASVVITVGLDDLLHHTGTPQSPTASAQDDGQDEPELAGFTVIKHVITNNVGDEAPADAMITELMMAGALITEPLITEPVITEPVMAEATVAESMITDQTSRAVTDRSRPGQVVEEPTASALGDRLRAWATRLDLPRPKPAPPHRTGRPRHGTTSKGLVLSIPEILDLAREADIYPAVCTANGQVLELGRTRRIATKNQTIALIARDGGCSFPGCDIGPQWCERHHIIGWEHNGATDLNNLTLLCSYHHHNFLQHGWQVRIPHGIPEWIAPRWLDRNQHPRINHRITARIHQAALFDQHTSR